MLLEFVAHIRGTTGRKRTRLTVVRGGAGVRRASVVVGREVELDRLLRAVRDARGGAASCVLLVGEGGVGKTRLMAETATAARRLGLGVLTGRAPITTPLPFSVIADALRSWLRGHAPPADAEPFRQGIRLVLPELPAPARAATDLTDVQLRLLAFEGIVQLVRAIAAENDGAVVLLDDLHAADPDSLEAARYLASAAIEGVSVVGGLRPRESALADELVRSLRSNDVVDLLELAPLGERGVTDLVAALLDAEPPPALVADIVARTDGVPLLVEEVLDAHLVAGTVDRSEGGAVWRGGAIAVPRTVREMVEARLSRLRRLDADVLVAGAVVGDFDASLLAAVVPDATNVADALADGIRVGLLETTGGAIGFRHAIIRDAVLSATVPHVIDALHRRVVDALASQADRSAHALERQAHHLLAVGERDAAALLLARAAQARVGEHALLGAERLARSALELASTEETRGAAADALAASLAAQGRWSDALDVDASAVKEHGDTPARRERMALSALEAGRPDTAAPIIQRALDAGDDSPLIQIAAGRVAVVTGDAQRALRHAALVLEAAERTGDVDARLSALELQGRAYDYLGQREDAEAAWEGQAREAATAGRTQAQLRAVVQLGKVELFAGKPPVRLYEAVELARDAGAFVELAWAQENLAISLAVRGDIAGSRVVLDEAVPRCRELRLDQLPYLLMGQAANLSHFVDSVDDLLSEAEALAPTDDFRLHVTSIRGDIALRRGRYDDAVHWFGCSLDIMRTMPGIVPIDAPCWLVLALAAVGRAETAAEVLSEVRAMPDLARWHGRPILADAGDALLAGDEAGVDRAIEQLAGNAPLDVALLRMVAADVMRGPSQVRWLREALDAYEAMGAPLAADRARHLLREAGGPVPRRRRSTAVPPGPLADRGVTAREAEVLRLVGEGLSNADIAGRLYLSVRTVETHVSSLLAKLDARSRGQLTAMAATIPFP